MFESVPLFIELFVLFEGVYGGNLAEPFEMEEVHEQDLKTQGVRLKLYEKV